MPSTSLIPARILLRRQHPAGTPALIRAICVHICLVATAFWTYQCLIGGISGDQGSFAGWRGFPCHFETWSDGIGGPPDDSSAERAEAIRLDIIICASSTLLLAGLMSAVGWWAFRRPPSLVPGGDAR